MAHGGRAINGGGALTFSSDGMIFGYLGKATNTAVAQADASMLDAFAGYSTYTMTWAGRIIVALPLVEGKRTALRSVSQSGSTWTITVHNGSGATDARGFDIQEALEVFVFGAPTVASGWGLLIRNQAGEITGDLSRRPLFFDRFVALGDGVDSAAMAGLTKPAFIGAQPALQFTTASLGGGVWENRIISGGWTLESGALARAAILTNRYQDDGPAATSAVMPAVNVVLIEASPLA